MRGTRPHVNKGYTARPAIEGIVVGEQKVKYERDSDVYLTDNFGNLKHATPVNPARLDPQWIYEGRTAYREGNRIKRIGEQVYGGAIETVVATMRPLLEEGQVICIRPHSEKAKVMLEKGRLKGKSRSPRGAED